MPVGLKNNNKKQQNMLYYDDNYCYLTEIQEQDPVK